MNIGLLDDEDEQAAAEEAVEPELIPFAASPDDSANVDGAAFWVFEQDKVEQVDPPVFFWRETPQTDGVPSARRNARPASVVVTTFTRGPEGSSALRRRCARIRWPRASATARYRIVPSSMRPDVRGRSGRDQDPARNVCGTCVDAE